MEDPRKYMAAGATEKPLLLSFEIPNMHRVIRERYMFRNPLLPDTHLSRYLFYVWKGLA